MPTRPLDRLLFAQGGFCFFCRNPLAKADASVEHLVASANGGNNHDGNCVVCCKAMNALLGSMSLKEKVQVVLNQKGRFRCPNGTQKALAKPLVNTASRAATDKINLVVTNLQQRGASKPKTVKTLTSTIRSLFGKEITEGELALLLRQLQARGIVSFDGTKVAYAK